MQNVKVAWFVCGHQWPHACCKSPGWGCSAGFSALELSCSRGYSNTLGFQSGPSNQGCPLRVGWPPAAALGSNAYIQGDGRGGRCSAGFDALELNCSPYALGMRSYLTKQGCPQRGGWPTAAALCSGTKRAELHGVQHGEGAGRIMDMKQGWGHSVVHSHIS
jgi:hypothetical protein